MSQLIPGNALGFLLTDVSRLFRQAFEKGVEASGLDLTPGEIRALAHVARNNGARQAVLAEGMGVEPMTLSAYIDRLELRGLVTRMVDPTDRRAKVIQLTAKVDKVFDDVRPIAVDCYNRATRGLSETEIRVLETGLIAMRANLGADPELPQRKPGEAAAVETAA